MSARIESPVSGRKDSPVNCVGNENLASCTPQRVVGVVARRACREPAVRQRSETNPARAVSSHGFASRAKFGGRIYVAGDG